ncbi:MAG: hypothetical protein OEW75_03775, partial [Cyclobacteriaceae bacterium]|nr:hypothetical protein [Cyclobacteriaceae bacterium]
LMFVENWEIPFSQSISGYYNNLGDAHIFNKEETSARGYYTKGGQYSYSSHRSNYALAKMSIEEEKFDDALEFYNKAVSQRPTEYAYINLSNLYLSQNQYFEALFNLQEGLKTFPQSGPLKNNVGLLYARGSSLDSAIHYLKEAMNDERSERIAYNNIFNILAKTDISINADSIEFKNENDWVNKVNRLAYLNSVKKPDNTPFIKPDSSINTLTHSYLYNVMTNSLWSKDTSYFDQIKANEQGNIYFERRIKLAFALNRYFKGKVNSALQGLKEISFGEPEWSGNIGDILGKIYLQLGDEKSAINHFAEAVDHGNENSRLGLAMALTRSAKSENAIPLWDSLSLSKNEELKNLSASVLKILKITSLEEALKLDDPQKYQFLIFNNFKFEEDLINSFKDLNYKAQALLLLASREYDLEHTQNAVQLYQKIKEIPVSESFVQNEMDILEMKLAALYGNGAVLESKLNNVQISEGLRQYFLSQMLLIKGDSTGAESIFNEWAELNPYNEDMVILAYKFYEKKGENGKAYDILQKGASGNAFSVKLLKEYVKYCGRNGNTNFGYSALREARSLLSLEDYEALYSEFEKGLEQWNSFTR